MPRCRLPGYAEVTFAVSVDGGAVRADRHRRQRALPRVLRRVGSGAGHAARVQGDRRQHVRCDLVRQGVGGGRRRGTTRRSSGFDYAVIHYNRPAGDYGDHTTGDFNDFWGLHLWGDAIDSSEVTDWTAPKPFEGEDEFGRFAWIRRGGATARSTSSSTRATPRTRPTIGSSTPTATLRSGSTRVTQPSTPPRPTPRASPRSAITATTATTAPRAPTTTRTGACTCGATRSTHPKATDWTTPKAAGRHRRLRRVLAGPHRRLAASR